VQRYLLDANHISIAIRRPAALRERIAGRRSGGDRFGTCVPVLCEVEAGIRQLRSASDHRKRLAHLRHLVRLWPIDSDLIGAYGDFHQLAKQRGRVLSFVDLLLLAITRTLDAILLTTDQDFDAFPEVRTENWAHG